MVFPTQKRCLSFILDCDCILSEGEAVNAASQYLVWKMQSDRCIAFHDKIESRWRGNNKFATHRLQFNWFSRTLLIFWHSKERPRHISTQTFEMLRKCSLLVCRSNFNSNLMS